MDVRLHTRQHFTNLPLAALAIGGLLTLFVAIGAATSTSANAEFWVKANGKILEGGEQELYKWDLTSVKFVWAAGAEKLKVLCKEGKGNGKIIGGIPGTDKLTEFELKECKLVEPPLNCVLQKERVGGEELPWPSTLELRGRRIFDNITFKKIPFKVEKCNNAALNLLWILNGNLLVEMQNNTGKVKTIFPGSEVEGDSLKTEGDKVLMTGEGEMEATETGETIEVGQEELWQECAEAGGSNIKYPSRSDCEKSESPGSGSWEWAGISSTKLVLSKGVGAQIIKVPATAAEISCSSLKSDSEIFPNGTDEILSAVYTGCTVVKPTDCKYVSSPGEPNGTVALAAGLPSKLALRSGLLVDEIEENSALKEFVTLLVRKEESESSAKCGLIPKTSTVVGTDYAMVNNAAQKLESLGEGTLKAFGALEAKYEGSVLQELEGGLKFLANK